MRVLLSLAMALALAVPAAAQQPEAAAVTEGATPAQPAGGDPVVSLDHIREGLRRAQNRRLLQNLELQPTFKISIEEQDRINHLMSKLDVPKPGPVPGAGWYGYEQQRQLFNPADRPLQQPYAAFSGGQFVTIALENILGRFAGKKIANAVQGSERSHAEIAAQQQVERSIADYCNARSDRDFIQLCASRER